MGLLVWQFITLFDLNLQLKNDFILIAGILLLGFFLVSLTSVLFIERKINKNFLFIKDSLLHLIENAIDHNSTRKKTKSLARNHHYFTSNQKSYNRRQAAKTISK